MSIILSLSGMSTSGKSTFATKLCSTGLFDEAVSVTTRPMRAGEVNGKDYHFVTQEVFDRYVANGILLEHVKSHSACYGVPKFEVERIRDEGKSAVIVLEPNGVSAIHRIAPSLGQDLVSVFLSVDDEILVQRFFERISSQVAKGKEPDPAFEAKRLHTMLTQESAWKGRWDWDYVFENHHRWESEAVCRVVALHNGDTPTPVRREKALRGASELRAPSMAELSRMIAAQCSDPKKPREFLAEIWRKIALEAESGLPGFNR